MQDCDREAVLTLQNTGWTALTSPVYDRKWTESDLEKNLANGMSFFVAEVDDKIAGVLDFGPSILSQLASMLPLSAFSSLNPTKVRDWVKLS